MDNPMTSEVGNLAAAPVVEANDTDDVSLYSMHLLIDGKIRNPRKIFVKTNASKTNTTLYDSICRYVIDNHRDLHTTKACVVVTDNHGFSLVFDVFMSVVCGGRA